MQPPPCMEPLLLCYPSQDDEFLSALSMKNGSKLLCGTQSGVLCIFGWGKWGDIETRFPGHPESVDTMLKVDESTVITGSSDGMLRVSQIQPDKVRGTPAPPSPLHEAMTRV